MKRIAAFLECAYLGMKAMKIDKGMLSRIYRKEALPGQQRCSVLLEICRSHLPVRTVDDEFAEMDFCLLPGAEKRIEDVITSSRSPEERGQFNSIFGDAKVSTDDIIRLVKPDSWNGNGEEERFWLSGDTINVVTNLYCSLRNDRRVFIFDTYFVQKYCDTYFNKSIGEERKRERLEYLRQSDERTRSGQKSSFEEAQIVSVPCLVNTNQWVGFRVKKPNSTRYCIDSMHIKKLDPGGRYSFPILKLLVSMSSRDIHLHWTRQVFSTAAKQYELWRPYASWLSSVDTWERIGHRSFRKQAHVFMETENCTQNHNQESNRTRLELYKYPDW